MKRAVVLSAALACGLGGASAVAGVGCDQPDNHLLVGEQYVPGAACLGVPAAVDDLAGSDPGESCIPECLTTSQSGQKAIYVTTTCPPYSPQYTAEIRDASHDSADPCFAAFAIYADGAICSGSPTDGATEAAAADGAADAAGDAPDGADGIADGAGDADSGATVEGGAG